MRNKFGHNMRRERTKGNGTNFLFSPSNEGEKQKVLRYIECDQHPPYCYLQDDGTHLQRDSCICGFFENPDCPINLHRYWAGKGQTGESRLEI